MMGVYQLVAKTFTILCYFYFLLILRVTPNTSFLFIFNTCLLKKCYALSKVAEL